MLLTTTVAVSQEADSLYRQAYEMQRAGDLAGAASKYREVLEAYPGHVGARSNLGAVLAGMGHYEEAIGEYKQALALLNHPGIRRNLALAFYKSARLREAIGELEGLRGEAPEDLDLAILLADCHFRLGEESAVVEVLAPLAASYPDHLGLAYLLGTAYIRQGEVATGQALIEKILGKGESAEGHLLLGMARERGAALEEAAAEFEQAVALNADLPTAWSLLGMVRLQLNEREAAAEAFRRELQGDPNNFEANLYLGVILRESGEASEALAFLEHAVRLRPLSPKARYQLGSVLVQLSRFGEAVPVLKALVEAEPNFPEAHVSLATAYLRLGDKQQAAEHRKTAQRLMTSKK